MTIKKYSGQSFSVGLTALGPRIAAIFALLSFSVLLLCPLAAVAKDKKPFPDVRIPGFARNEHAIQALGDKLAEVADWYGKDPEELKRLFRNDSNLWAGPTGRLMYACELETPLLAEADAPPGTIHVQMTSAPLDQTFKLHSSPNSERVLYLDFNGAVISGTVWNGSYAGGKDIVAAPFDADGDPTTFSATELDVIQKVWRRVAEDYSAFDIDVTTEEPASDAITRSSNNDTRFGNRVIVTPTNFYPNAGGVSYIGIFDDVGDYYKPSFAFSNMLLNSEKFIGEACSHESGHSLGLHHNGKTDGIVYYQGQGDWAPIMGNSYYRNVSQWSKGEYTGANNKEDQLQLIQSFGLTYYTDDHGNTAATATTMSGSGSISGSGFIERSTDLDVFQFTTGAGAVSFAAVPSPLGPNLDIKAEIRDGNWNILAQSPAPGLGASLSATLPAGVYYLVISGTGDGDPLSTGYSNYGSLGSYALTGTIADPGSLQPPTAVASANLTSGYAPLAVFFTGSSSADAGGGSIVGYSWDFGDGTGSSEVNPSHVYTAPGTYTATLVVTDNDDLTGTARLTISVLNPVLVNSITLNAQGASLVSVSATVAVADRSGNPVGGAAVTGTWSGLVQGSATGSTSGNGSVSFLSPETSSTGTIVFTVNSVSAPGYSYDAALNEQSSNTITVAPTTGPPSVSITAPAANSTVSGSQSVQISAGSSLGIASVSLSVDGVLLGTDTTSPYAFTWNTSTVVNGGHTLTATAKDKAGITYTVSLSVNVNNVEDTIAPTIGITFPRANATVSGNISVLVSVSDNVGVVKVELYVDGASKPASSSTRAPFTTKWNASKATRGTHTLRCKAYDAAGNTAEASVFVFR